MSEQNDGGPAFPGRYDDRGLSLLDYFAGQVLVGAISHGDSKLVEAYGQEDDRILAKAVYRVAEAMLEERARRAGKLVE